MTIQYFIERVRFVNIYRVSTKCNSEGVFSFIVFAYNEPCYDAGTFSFSIEATPFADKVKQMEISFVDLSINRDRIVADIYVTDSEWDKVEKSLP